MIIIEHSKLPFGIASMAMRIEWRMIIGHRTIISITQRQTAGVRLIQIPHGVMNHNNNTINSIRRDSRHHSHLQDRKLRKTASEYLCRNPISHHGMIRLTGKYIFNLLFHFPVILNVYNYFLISLSFFLIPDHIDPSTLCILQILLVTKTLPYY